MMGRPYHGRRRRRPRKRYRFRGGLLSRTGSYHDVGMRIGWDWLMPHVRGRDRRRFFNEVSAGMAVACGVFGAALGWGVAGPFGVVLGWLVGFAIAAGSLTRNGFYRR